MIGGFNALLGGSLPLFAMFFWIPNLRSSSLRGASWHTWHRSPPYSNVKPRLYPFYTIQHSYSPNIRTLKPAVQWISMCVTIYISSFFVLVDCHLISLLSCMPSVVINMDITAVNRQPKIFGYYGWCKAMMRRRFPVAYCSCSGSSIEPIYALGFFCCISKLFRSIFPTDLVHVRNSLDSCLSSNSNLLSFSRDYARS